MDFFGVFAQSSFDICHAFDNTCGKQTCFGRSTKVAWLLYGLAGQC